MDLFGPSRTASLSGKHYTFVIVNDFSRFTWLLFLTYKDDVLKPFTTPCKKVQNVKGYTITSIRSDHSGEFDNNALEAFCNEYGFELEHHNKMVWRKGKIEHFKKWIRPC